MPRLGDRVLQAVELAHAIARYVGCFVVLIHPNVLDRKLEFEKRFVEAVKPFAWFGSVSQFGQWWAARNEVAVDVSVNGARYVLTLYVPTPMAGLTIEVPSGWTLESRGSLSVAGEQVGRSVILHEASGPVTLHFSLSHSTPR